jgi:hypothetical protein
MGIGSVKCLVTLSKRPGTDALSEISGINTALGLLSSRIIIPSIPIKLPICSTLLKLLCQMNIILPFHVHEVYDIYKTYVHADNSHILHICVL